MTGVESLEWVREALLTALMLCSPVLLVGALVGVVVGMLQSVMQLHDQTLSFVPKFVTTVAVLVLVIPWLMQELATYASRMFSGLPGY